MIDWLDKAGGWIVEKYETAKSWVWAAAGNSRTIMVAYAAELLALLDEFKLLDWSSLVGENSGKVVAVMGVVIFVLRIITREPVSFQR